MYTVHTTQGKLPVPEMMTQPQPWQGQTRSNANVGVVVLENDPVSGPTLQALLGDKAAVQVARMHSPGAGRDVTEFEESLQRAAMSIMPSYPPTIMAMACTTGAMRLGPQRVRAALLRPGLQIETVDPLASAFSALRHLGLEHVAILSPYSRDVTSQIAEAFCDNGFPILRLGYFDAKDAEITSIADRSIVSAAESLAGSRIDALFLSCTGMPAVPLIEIIEQRVDIPVLTSLSVMAWQIARGLDVEIAGRGRLFGKAPR